MSGQDVLRRDEDLERALTGVLREEAPAAAPPDLWRRVRSQVAVTPQRRRRLAIPPLPWRLNRLAMLAAGATAAAIVLAAAVGMLTSQDRDPVGPPPSATPTTTPAAAAITNVIGAPVVAAGSLWAAQDGTESVLRIDPATMHVLAAIQVGDELAGALATDGAHVWVAARRADGWGVERINPASNEVVERIPVRHQPTSMALADRTLWVSSSRGRVVMRIDVDAAAGVAEIPTTDLPHAVAATAEGAWVAMSGTGSAARIDAASNTLVVLEKQPVVLELGPVSAVVLTDDEVWMAGLTVRQVIVYARDGDQLLDRLGFQRPMGMARDGNLVWIADGPYDEGGDDARVIAVDIATGDIVHEIALPGVSLAAPIAAFDGAAWAILDGTLTRLEPKE